MERGTFSAQPLQSTAPVDRAPEQAKQTSSESLQETSKETSNALINTTDRIKELGINTYSSIQNTLKAVTESPADLPIKLTESFRQLAEKSTLIKKNIDTINTAIKDSDPKKLMSAVRELSKEYYTTEKQDGEISAVENQARQAARSLAAAKMALAIDANVA